MELQEYLQMCTLLACKGNGKKNYDKTHFTTPWIICKDGFSISIQVGSIHYCESENGYRTYGDTWVKAEWGFPSEPIDGEKYDCEMCCCKDFTDEDTTESVGCADVKDLQGLLDEHGGMDVIQTFKNGWDTIESYFV